MKTWNGGDVATLISWMEDHQELLRGSISAWSAQAAKELFPNIPDRSGLKIKQKYHNMKRQWSKAKEMQNESGISRREEDCEAYIIGLEPPAFSFKF